MQTFLGNDETAAVRLVRELRLNKPLQVVSHGNDNLVILCGNEVFRFPRNEAVWARGELEQFVLGELCEHPELSAPVLKHVHENPAYTISTALDGTVLENNTIRNLTAAQQTIIGHQLGHFAYTFHSLMDPKKIRPLLQEKHPQNWYAHYLEVSLPNTPEPFLALAQRVLDSWGSHDHADTTVIHDDLHSHNLLFDSDNSLSGVLDFGDVNLGNPEQDLRYTYWMGDTVMNAALATYEQASGKTLDRELVVLCAVSQELSGLADSKRSYMHARAKANLDYRRKDLISFI